MKRQFLLMLLIIITSSICAQQQLKKQFTVAIPGSGGRNSCSVVWHPLYKKYFTAMVGNYIFPITSFDANGKNAKEVGETGIDIRGMWYNPIFKRIEFNSYDSAGIGYYKQGKDGSIEENIIIKAGNSQPDEQSVGTYMKEGNKLLFLPKYGNVQCYNAKTFEMLKEINIYIGCKNENDKEKLLDLSEVPEDARNMSQIAYTGIKGSELGILVIEDNKIELYNIKTGLVTKVLQLPKDAIVNKSFNFCFNNGMWWLFDTEDRSWTAYK
jgi:hypothetical protein